MPEGINSIHQHESQGHAEERLVFQK